MNNKSSFNNLGIRLQAGALNFLIMDDNKNISNPKPKKAERQVLTDSEKLNMMIAKNPKLKTLIEKLDLVLINTTQS